MAAKKDVSWVVEGNFEHAKECEVVIAEAHASRRACHLKISELTCPYQAGQIILTNSGLGLNGLVIDSVVAVVEARGPLAESNRWAVQTWALSKAGEVTKRAVYIDEGMGLEIKVRH